MVAVGRLRAVHAFFAYFNKDPHNIRNQADLGGGALMDIGCYGVSLARFLFEREPERVCAHFDQDPEFGTDRLTSALMDFGDGAATFTCATQLHRYQRAHALGDAGRIELEIPFNAPVQRPVSLWHEHGDKSETIRIDPVDQYAVQADDFARAVLHGAAMPTSLHDALCNMRAIDALFESGERRAWVDI